MKTLLIFLTRVFLTILTLILALCCFSIITDGEGFEKAWSLLIGIIVWYIGKSQWVWWKKFLSED